MLSRLTLISLKKPQKILFRSFSVTKLPESKVVQSAKDALQNINLKGALVAVGGFGTGGNPETLLNELSRTHGASDLTVASLTGGLDGFGLGKLLEAGKVKRLMSSYVGENKFLEQEFFGGRLQVELIPQGTLAERLNAAGAGKKSCTALLQRRYTYSHFYVLFTFRNPCLLHTNRSWNNLLERRCSYSIQD